MLNKQKIFNGKTIRLIHTFIAYLSFLFQYKEVAGVSELMKIELWWSLSVEKRTPRGHLNSPFWAYRIDCEARNAGF